MKSFGIVLYYRPFRKVGPLFLPQAVVVGSASQNYKVSDGQTGEFLGIVPDDISPIWIMNFLLNLTFGFQAAAVERKVLKYKGGFQRKFIESDIYLSLAKLF